MRQRPRWLTYGLIAIGLVLAALIGRWFASAGAKKNAHTGRPVAAVAIARVVPADVPVTVSAIGTVTPIDSAIVRTQLAGNLLRILFREGQQVHAGQVIAVIDQRPFEIALQQAEGNLTRDAAQLADAQLDLARYRKLLGQQSIASQQVDTQAALVKQLAGTVAADRGAVNSARLNIDYSAIKAPFDGVIGLRQVTLGNYVQPSDTNGIAVVTRTDPIDVEFALPQSQLDAIRRRAGSPEGLPVTALDQNNQSVLAQGRFGTFDNQIATATGTVNAKARFANPGTAAKQALFPNQFVNVTMRIDTLHHVDTVPVTAVRHGAPGDFVFVVQPDSTVKLTVVTTGPSDGATIAVLQGLQAGQTVVTEGADGLDDGSMVRLPRAHGGPAGASRSAAGGGQSGHRHRPAAAQ
ncbi:MAG: efflux RND transporter periplasmic adaptor subunit [Sphingomonadales bacterium]|nr:efflux RND transporter periplasmic adaptor subunit [Sphingomonadales bacterium]